jgi:hypothetical protein
VTFSHNPQFPKPGPAPGGFRPGPPPVRPVYAAPAAPAYAAPPVPAEEPADADAEDGTGTGHPAVDAVLRSLENAARLAPGAQIAEYEAAHQVLQETLASIDG